jgi:hypothetical protein
LREVRQVGCEQPYDARNGSNLADLVYVEKSAARAGCFHRVAMYKSDVRQLLWRFFEGVLFVTLFVTSGRRLATTISDEEVRL